MASRRFDLAKRRKAMGFSQESLAAELRVDRSTVVRWESGETGPLPYIRPKLARLLHITPRALVALLSPTTPGHQHPTVGRAVYPTSVIGPLTPELDLDTGERDDMNRRELLRLISVAGTLVTVPVLDGQPATAHAPRPLPEAADLMDHLEQLNSHLWQVFSVSTSKRTVYPLVRQQLEELTTRLGQPQSDADHKRLCTLGGNLFQLAGEIFFDGNRYTDAAYYYTLVASASREADAYDLWACALTRHAFIGMHERRFDKASPLLAAASQVARRGDTQLSTRHWVAAVQAETFAGLGNLNACNRALEAAELVHTLDGQPHNGGWLRFDGSRLAEQRGTCNVELGRSDLAATALTDALQQKLSPRRRGSVLTNLAALGIQRHDIDQLLQYGRAALELAQLSDSGYVTGRLQSLQPQLAPLASDHRVAELQHRITALAGAAG